MELTVVHRTDDPALLNCLSVARVKQPSRDITKGLFRRASIAVLIKRCRQIWLVERAQTLFVWLCVTNKGVRDVNLAAISQLGPLIKEADLKS